MLYESTKFWKPCVNRLVLLNVGGFSLVSIIFKNEGIELPTAFYIRNTKTKNIKLTKCVRH